MTLEKLLQHMDFCWYWTGRSVRLWFLLEPNLANCKNNPAWSWLGPRISSQGRSTLLRRNSGLWVSPSALTRGADCVSCLRVISRATSTGTDKLWRRQWGNILRSDIPRCVTTLLFITKILEIRQEFVCLRRNKIRQDTIWTVHKIKSTQPPDVKQIFIYKLLHSIGLGPEVHFIVP
jgi:hypothetical protein